jgi:hypothetical protein
MKYCHSPGYFILRHRAQLTRTTAAPIGLINIPLCLLKVQ